MPDWGTLRGAPQQPVARPATGGGIWAGFERREATPDLEPEIASPTPREGLRTLAYEPPDDEGVSAGQAGAVGAAGGLGLLAAGLLRRNPKMAYDAFRKLGSAVNTARYTSMLSGLAPVKSAMGNLGATIVHAAESGSAKAPQEFFKRKTMQDWWAAMKDPAITNQIQGGGSKWNLPGRIMGAGDHATREALKRAGLTEEETLRATLMTPLSQNYGKLGTVLDSPAAEVLIPFRRVPFNQFWEGLRTLHRDHPHKRVTAGAAAVGSAAGAASAEQEYPMLPALVAAVAGRYGLPVGLAAALTRIQMGEGGGGIAGSLLPVSEYGFEESLKNPLRPLDPQYWGIVRAYRRIAEGR